MKYCTLNAHWLLKLNQKTGWCAIFKHQAVEMRKKTQQDKTSKRVVFLFLTLGNRDEERMEEVKANVLVNATLLCTLRVYEVNIVVNILLHVRCHTNSLC